MTEYASLLLALEGYFEAKLDELPEVLRERVQREIRPCAWDHLSPKQRRSWAWQTDYQNDLAAEEGGDFWFNFYNRKDELRKQISEWASIPALTAGELTAKERRLEDLRHEFALLERLEKEFRVSHYPKKESKRSPDPELSDVLDAKDQYVAYPNALMQWAKRLGASPEELAAWLFVGPELGGLSAYLNANELEPPREFHFAPCLGNDLDYLSPLMGCWFRKDDVLNFSPTKRFITGAALIERWSQHWGIRPEAYIRAKIEESRLQDIHPLSGVTQGRVPGDEEYPPMSSGLFGLSEIEAIEQEDFDCAEDGESVLHESPASLDGLGIGSPEWRSQNARKAANARHDRPGGSRDRQQQIRAIWATGKYTSRDRCAEEECVALDMSISTARKALINTVDPKPKPST